jgi:large subunit ribosomal protein L4
LKNIFKNTKNLSNKQIREKNKYDGRTVMILNDGLEAIRRAGNNIPWLNLLSFNRLKAHDMFYGKNILILESAALKLNDFYGAAKSEAQSK